MATIKILAGDFLEGNGSFTWGSFTLRTRKHNFSGETISANQIETIDIATEENVKKLGGTVGWGLAGAAILGPVGLLAGLLLGGKKKEVVFIIKFRDNRKLLASSDIGTYTKIQSASFGKNNIKTEPITVSQKSELDNSDELEKLIKLNDMLEKGLITENEFKEFKNNLHKTEPTHDIDIDKCKNHVKINDPKDNNNLIINDDEKQKLEEEKQKQLLDTIQTINSKYNTRSDELLHDIYNITEPTKAHDLAEKNNFDFTLMISLFKDKQIIGRKENGIWYIETFNHIIENKRKIYLENKKVKSLDDIIEIINFKYNLDSTELIQDINNIKKPVEARYLAEKNNITFPLLIEILENKDLKGYKENGVWYISNFS